MDYQEAIGYIESLSPTTKTPCLERIAAFMAELGNPQDRYRSIHVGGTNGKGSTVAILDTLLRWAGLKVGRYIGPHLLRWNERFHVNGCPIGNENFAELTARLKVMSEDFGLRHPEFGELTWFEFLTALAFIYFAEQEIDVAVVEVGLGGRWDATNILGRPLVSAITCVDLDHMQILGETIREIAGEKAGIIKPEVPVVTAAAGDALEEIVKRCRVNHSYLLHCVAPDTVLQLRPERPVAQRMVETNLIHKLMQSRTHLSLSGPHQQMNAQVAVAALAASGLDEAFAELTPSRMRNAWSSVFWPARFQMLPELHLVMDGAHNPSGARALRRALEECFPGSSFIFVLGCFQNKNVSGMIQALCRGGDKVMAVEAPSRRATCPAERIVQLSEACLATGLMCQTVAEALEVAASRRRSDEIIVVTGSFATIRESMLHLGWSTVEDSLAMTQMNWTKACGIMASRVL